MCKQDWFWKKQYFLVDFDNSEIYILLKTSTDQVFISVFFISRSKRTGKCCALILSYFLGHPNMHV
jgi:hypothetical protein